MRYRPRRSASRLARYAGLLALAACYRAPEPDCGFVCGPGRSCPADYTCGTGDVCRRNGTGSSESCPGGGDAPTSAPSVIRTEPTSGATDVPLDAQIAAFVDQDLRGVTESSFYLLEGGASVPAVASFDSAALAARLLPSTLLDAHSNFTVMITRDVTNTANAPLGPYLWSFTTGDDQVPPHLISSAPADGDTNVSTSTTIRLVFDEAVSGVTGSTVMLSAAGSPVADSVSMFDAVTFTVQPATTLPAMTTVTVTLTPGIRDLAGNALVQTSFAFTTR
jgi:Big-like domain-containing protein